MRDPFTLFETTAFAATLDPRVAPDGGARTSTKA